MATKMTTRSKESAHGDQGGSHLLGDHVPFGDPAWSPVMSAAMEHLPPEKPVAVVCSTWPSSASHGTKCKARQADGQAVTNALYLDSLPPRMTARHSCIGRSGASGTGGGRARWAWRLSSRPASWRTLGRGLRGGCQNLQVCRPRLDTGRKSQEAERSIRTGLGAWVTQ